MDNNQCQPCSFGCAVCTDSNTCTSCVDGLYINSDGILIVTSRNKQSENVTNEKSIVIDQYIKSNLYNLEDYVYDDDYDKIKDSELANKILAKIELNHKYEMYKRLNGENCDQEFLDKLQNMIKNFENYCNNKKYSNFILFFMFKINIFEQTVD